MVILRNHCSQKLQFCSYWVKYSTLLRSGLKAAWGCDNAEHWLLSVWTYTHTHTHTHTHINTLLALSLYITTQTSQLPLPLIHLTKLCMSQNYNLRFLFLIVYKQSINTLYKLALFGVTQALWHVRDVDGSCVQLTASVVVLMWGATELDGNVSLSGILCLLVHHKSCNQVIITFEEWACWFHRIMIIHSSSFMAAVSLTFGVP